MFAVGEGKGGEGGREGKGGEDPEKE